MTVDFREYQGMTFTVGPHLSHEGVIGQRWGERHGPPYPLTRKAKIQAGYVKSNGKVMKRKEIKQVEAARKRAMENRARLKAEDEHYRKLKEEDPDYENRKRQALRYGTAEDIWQFKGDLSSSEIQNALNRLESERKLAEAVQKQREAGWTSINKIMDKAGDVNKWMTTGITAYNNVSSIKKIVDDLTKVTPAVPVDTKKLQTLRSGSAKDILKYKGNLSADELKAAVQRLENEKKLFDAAQSGR